MTARTEAPATAVGPTAGLRPHRTFWGDMVRSFRRGTSALVGLAIVLVFLVASVWGVFATPPDTNRSRLNQRLNPPSAEHLMGTDGFGRDVLNRVLQGAPLALLVGVVSVAGGGIVGCALGLVAGYYRGGLGAGIMRLVDAMLAFPTL